MTLTPPRDTKLDRDIAIKVLPEAFAHDADRLARFLREAKTLAALNHPNIAAICGLEEASYVGRDFGPAGHAWADRLRADASASQEARPTSPSAFSMPTPRG